MYCHNCGVGVPENTQFCINCGVSLISSHTSDTPPLEFPSSQLANSPHSNNLSDNSSVHLRGESMATAALICGIISIPALLFWPIALIIGILAIVFGIIAKRQGTQGSKATIGIITGIIGLIIPILIVLLIAIGVIIINIA